MPVPEPDVVPFSPDDPAALATEIAALGPGGWANLQTAPDPEHDDDGQGEPGVLGRLFSARGPARPLCTVLLPSDPAGPLTLGIQHGTGAKAVPRLRAAGCLLDDARIRTDNPRRGLVVEVPVGDLTDRLRWLLRAAEVLTEHPGTGEWHAALYRAG